MHTHPYKQSGSPAKESKQTYSQLHVLHCCAGPLAAPPEQRAALPHAALLVGEVPAEAGQGQVRLQELAEDLVVDFLQAADVGLQGTKQGSTTSQR
jgi:hypothetical protein